MLGLCVDVAPTRTPTECHTYAMVQCLAGKWEIGIAALLPHLPLGDTIEPRCLKIIVQFTPRWDVVVGLFNAIRAGGGQTLDTDLCCYVAPRAVALSLSVSAIIEATVSGAIRSAP